jgi:hypothetical protein
MCACGSGKSSSQLRAIAFTHNRVFGTDTLFIRTKNTVGAQSAQWQIADRHRCGHLHRAAMIELARTAARPRGSPIAHGRKSVRTQSAILDKGNPKRSLLISVRKPRLARAARKSAFYNYA